jgi:Ubiquinol-cytochrome C chaperone
MTTSRAHTHRKIQECLFDELWEDTTSRLRHTGVKEMMLNKFLSETQGYSFKFCVELDNALKLETEDKILDEFGGTLWRNLYAKRDEIEVDHVLELTRYLAGPAARMSDSRFKAFVLTIPCQLSLMTIDQIRARRAFITESLVY